MTRAVGRLWLVLLIVSATATAAAIAVAFYFSWVSHSRSGVPWNHYTITVDGSHYYRPTGAPAAQRPRYPITEDQYLTWQYFHKRSRSAAGLAALFGLPTAVLYVPYLLRIVGNRQRSEKVSARNPTSL